ncbi:hypothetical protein MMC17_002193 [Xylographa soralifera]|nr:hypothetical protein [Xylographa soralifera]
MTTDVARSESHRGPIKLRQLLDDTIVTVIVGEEKRVFKIHKNLLCSASSYFKAALDGKFKEAEEQKIKLLEEKPDILESFQLWLCTKSIIDEGESVTTFDFDLLIGIYVFAESRLVMALQNLAIDMIIRKAGKEKIVPRQSKIYLDTMAGSHLRRLVVDMAARIGLLCNWQWYDSKGELFNSTDYLVDLVKALYDEKVAARPQEDNFWKIRCNYHIHGEGEPRCPKDTPNPDKA